MSPTIIVIGAIITFGAIAFLVSEFLARRLSCFRMIIQAPLLDPPPLG